MIRDTEFEYKTFIYLFILISHSLWEKKKKNERGTELVPHFMYKLHT